MMLLLLPILAVVVVNVVFRFLVVPCHMFEEVLQALIWQLVDLVHLADLCMGVDTFCFGIKGPSSRTAILHRHTSTSFAVRPSSTPHLNISSVKLSMKRMIQLQSSSSGGSEGGDARTLRGTPHAEVTVKCEANKPSSSATFNTLSMDLPSKRRAKPPFALQNIGNRTEWGQITSNH